MRHLLAIADLERSDIERITDRAEGFAEVGRRDIKKVPTLRGRTVINLFYESSTRTSSSFELAAKRLSADVVTVKATGSSIDKGESLKDTIATLSAYGPEAIVIRSPHARAARRPWNPINAGDQPSTPRALPTPAPASSWTHWISALHPSPSVLAPMSSDVCGPPSFPRSPPHPPLFPPPGPPSPPSPSALPSPSLFPPPPPPPQWPG